MATQDELMQTIEENVPKVYEAGKRDGYVIMMSDLDTKSNALTREKFGDSIILEDVAPDYKKITVSVESRNLLPLEYSSVKNVEEKVDETTGETIKEVKISGITYTVYGDGRVKIYGQNDKTGNSSFFLASSSTSPLILKKGTHIGSTGVENLPLTAMRLDGSYINNLGTGYTAEKDTPLRYLYFGVNKGSTRAFNNEMAYPMLVRGTELPDSYILPAPPDTDVVVTGNGKNLFPHSIDGKTSVKNGITVTDSGDGYFTATGTASGDSYVPLHVLGFDVFRNGVFYVKSNGGNANCYLLIELYKGTKPEEAFSPIVANKFSDGFIMDLSSVQYDSLRIFIRSASGVNVGTVKFLPQIERGDKYTGYEEYVSESVNGKVGENVVLSPCAPIMNIRSDNIDNNVKLVVEYNRDINIAFAELQQAIISLGGNV